MKWLKYYWKSNPLKRALWLTLRWFWPIVERHKLASGPYGGWHCVWGPFHFWNVTTHHKTQSKGFTWR